MAGSLDTDAESGARQLAVFARLTPGERLERMFEACDLVRGLARAGIRARHPDYDDGQVDQALVALLLGRDHAAELWPDHPPPEP